MVCGNTESAVVLLGRSQFPGNIRKRRTISFVNLRSPWDYCPQWCSIVSAAWSSQPLIKSAQLAQMRSMDYNKTDYSKSRSTHPFFLPWRGGIKSAILCTAYTDSAWDWLFWANYCGILCRYICADNLCDRLPKSFCVKYNRCSRCLSASLLANQDVINVCLTAGETIHDLVNKRLKVLSCIDLVKRHIVGTRIDQTRWWQLSLGCLLVLTESDGTLKPELSFRRWCYRVRRKQNPVYVGSGTG